MFDIFHAWNEVAVKLKNGEKAEEECNSWCYNYPRIEAERAKQKLDEQRTGDAN